jgi:S-adenosylmethionine decarboxylase
MKNQTAAAVSLPRDTAQDAYAYYIEREGVRFAGTHLLVDINGARNLSDIEVVERALREAVTATGATLLNIDLHHFSPDGGISGVAVLAESHISIHTWPETGYAAIDLFLCGHCNAYAAIPVFRRAFEPDHVQVSEHKRGLVV